MAPRALRAGLRIGTLALATVLAPACTASLDLDRFKADQTPLAPDVSAITYFDFKFTGIQMQSHLREFFEIRVVDKANRIQAKAIYNNVASPDFTIYLARVVPKANAPYRIDFWADHNSSGKYDGIEGGINEKDHAWRRELRDPLPEDVKLVGTRYELNFLHDTSFVDMFTDLQGNKIGGEDTLLPFKLKIVGGGAFTSKMLEFRVVERASGRLVGLFREGIGRESFDAEIKGILDEVTPYEISGYADVNGDGKYSAGDPSWKLDVQSTGEGVATQLDVATAPIVPIDTGETAAAPN